MVLYLILSRFLRSRNALINPIISSLVPFSTMDELEKEFSGISVKDQTTNNDKGDDISKIFHDKHQHPFSSSFCDETQIKLKTSLNKCSKKPTLESIAQLISDGTCKNIILMVGAGISTSVGIPDFRTKGSGLFDKLQKYNLPFKEAIFDIDFFRKNPKPFFALSRELLPGNFQPSLCHYFMALLYTENRLLRCYTQNIDGLERIAGMPTDKLIEAHGTFHTSHCTNRKCKKEYSLEWMKKIILKPEGEDNIPLCEKCNSVVKPDITFYGEMLPGRFYDLVDRDFRACDLLIILGTSLTVSPFANLVMMAPKDVKRLMINLTKPGDIDWDSDKNTRNVFVKMETDVGARKLAQLLGWEEKLDSIFENNRLTIQKETQEKKDLKIEKSKEEDEKKEINQIKKEEDDKEKISQIKKEEDDKEKISKIKKEDDEINKEKNDESRYHFLLSY